MVKTRLTRSAAVLGVVLAMPMLLNVTRASAAPPMPIAVARLVLIDNGQPIGTFQHLLGISSQVLPQEYVFQSGSGQVVHTKQFGKTSPPRVVLESGTASTQLRVWRRMVLTGKPTARQTVILEAVTVSGSIALSFTLHNAWPSQMEITGLKAGNSAIAVTRLTLMCESITRNA